MEPWGEVRKKAHPHIVPAEPERRGRRGVSVRARRKEISPSKFNQVKKPKTRM